MSINSNNDDSNKIKQCIFDKKGNYIILSCENEEEDYILIYELEKGYGSKYFPVHKINSPENSIPIIIEPIEIENKLNIVVFYDNNDLWLYPINN